MDKLYIGLLGGIILLSSCSTSKNTATLADLNGEWNIVEIDGTPLTVKAGSTQPYIVFDTKDGLIYGNSGCNRMSSALDTTLTPGTIDFGNMASTMMACPDMENEQLVLTALGNVNRYHAEGSNKVVLTGATGKTSMVLERRFEVIPYSELDGKWMIETVFGTSLPASLEQRPYLVFDTKAGKVHGELACNNMNGSIVHNDAEASSIAIPQAATTRMMCPDIETENSILTAINEVSRFGKIGNNRIAFFSEDGQQVLTLEKSAE